VIWLLAFALSLAGLGALALSQAKHHRELTGLALSPARRRALRIAGWTALAVATASCLHSFGVGYGLVVETALLNASGIVLTLALAYAGGGSRNSRRARG
jgi:hypothetical protein